MLKSSKIKNQVRITEMLSVMATVVFMICTPLMSQAQTLDQDYTIKYINSRLNNCDIQVNKNSFLIVTFYSKGQKARIDELFIGDIDPTSIAYFPEEGAVILRCTEKQGDCVKREMLLRDAISYYPRVNLTSGCSENDCKALERAVKHLVLLNTDSDYARTTPFENE